MIKANLSEYFPIDLSAYEVAHLILEKIEEGADAGKYKVLIISWLIEINVYICIIYRQKGV